MINIDKDILYRMYITEQKTIREIANLFNCSKTPITKLMDKYGIKRRSKGWNNKNTLSKPKQNLVGQKFGRLTVIGYRVGGHICECECGNTTQAKTHHLINGERKTCGKCLRGNKHHNWHGYKELSAQYISRTQRDAKKRKLAHSITLQYLWNLWTKQDGLCAISYVPITLDEYGKLGTASVDRIDSSYGYIQKNVQWTHKTVNLMKLSLAQDEFIKWCKIIANAN